MKRRKSTERSALGLIASGVTTIKIDNCMPRYRVRTVSGALKHDKEAINRYAQQAYAEYESREYA